MSRTATRATAALLSAVVLVALGLAFIGLPESETPAESLSVELDFDTFVPGVTQTRTSSVVIPVASRVTDAEITQAIGSTMAIDTELTICGSLGCQPLVPGLEIDPGSHTLTVDARLADTVAGDTPPNSTGGFSGQIRIVEAHEAPGVDTGPLIGISAIGLVTIAIGALIVAPRRRVVA